MSLVDQAVLDLSTTLSSPQDFGVPFLLTDPSGFQGDPGTDLHGLANDTGLLIDPNTGQGVSGRTAFLTVARADLVAAGFTDIPEGIPDENLTPWVIEVSWIGFETQQYTIKRTMPDRKLSLILIELEFWNG